MPAQDVSKPEAVAVAAESARVVLGAVRAELEELERRRADAAAIARAHWSGGDRVRFEECLAEVERQARRAYATVELLERAALRALDDARAEARAAATSGVCPP
jgi:hypothetical protein